MFQLLQTTHTAYVICLDWNSRCLLCSFCRCFRISNTTTLFALKSTLSRELTKLGFWKECGFDSLFSVILWHWCVMMKVIGFQKLGDETPSSKDTVLLKDILGTERFPRQLQGPLHYLAWCEKTDSLTNTASHLLPWAMRIRAGGEQWPLSPWCSNLHTQHFFTEGIRRCKPEWVPLPASFFSQNAFVDVVPGPSVPALSPRCPKSIEWCHFLDISFLVVWYSMSFPLLCSWDTRLSWSPQGPQATPDHFMVLNRFLECLLLSKLKVSRWCITFYSE